MSIKMFKEKKYNLNYLKQLEAESIHIIREAVAEFKNPVMLYSIGKDSSVNLRLAQKAFWPAPIPFPFMHIDTGYKFHEMIAFRDYYTKKAGIKLIVHKNEEPIARAMPSHEAHTDKYIYYKKTKPLLEALKKYNFDASFGGARREEEKSRAKERIFSIRNEDGVWNPKNQRPELWHLYNGRLNEGESARVFPLSNWTEVDIWQYIKQEKIEVVPLYFAEKRQVIRRHNVYLRLDNFVQPAAGEEVIEMVCRYRTLGCSPSTGAIPSTAVSFDEIIEEVMVAKKSERENRAIDHGSDSSMEQKKREGYF
ncbi:MAG: Sulfate adenylyltransferase, small subunit [Parcubacteria group bacterium GW2011_GWC2_42_6]|nr:MAG: Sulfate adenylyltransferase, small subunit [Parcubacteria group bacterium GW2011_GWA2_42_11]KKS66912.1 MAG: Sulfate adenylyltransferase, small subunit [Parcubacteria group bacterium GW2011_GWC2_42_6]